MNVHGLQIRGPRFDSGRRLQLITLKINLVERSQAPVYLPLLPPLPAEKRMKTPQNHTEK